ncbi:MAG: (2Fe-2S)-binding protein [Planctomycetaceae bacterium]|nr:(2Fe-2S)-binding protein [Planctomycetaceae bacterium]MDG2389059.1 (2Fe-2S)-binding protein [Planctomycetaceae bacterium]
MATVETANDKMVCYCYGLRESDIQQTVQLHGCQELQAVMSCSGAGTGCTACHRRIQAVMNKQTTEAYGSSSLPILD